MTPSADLIEYYRARAHEYERVYEKPERQSDLARLHARVAAAFSGRAVLEVACGTGYWTRRIAPTATGVTGCDLAPEVLELARLQQPTAHPATFVLGDAFSLETVTGDFDAAFVGFWWSHVPMADLPRFLRRLHRRVGVGSRVFIVDNRYVEGSSHPITRVDTAGNSYQERKLADGSQYEVLKNFPAADVVRAAIQRAGAQNVAVYELDYYWYATYAVASAV